MKVNDELMSTKSNALIQNYAWKLRQYELKIFEFVCCCYDTKYYDKEKNQISISFNDFATECDMLELTEGGIYYTKFKQALKKLSDTSIWVIKDNCEELLRIINKVTINKNIGIVICDMSDDYKKHMERSSLGNAFVELRIVTNMKSKYSIHLYNLIRSWDGMKQISLDIDYLKEKLCCTSSTYNNISLLKRTINNAIEEINDLSNIEVSYKTKKTGKKISTFVFEISKKVNSIQDECIVNQVNEQIEFERLMTDWLNSPYIEVMRNIIVEVLETKEDKIIISKMPFETNNVKKAFKKIKYENIVQILNNINQNNCDNEGSYIKYLKDYLKSSLYFNILPSIEFEEYKDQIPTS